MPPAKFRVAICGGGIGELSLAATLCKRANVHVKLYEAAPEIGTIGTGISLCKRTWDVMQNLGLDEEMRKRNFPLPKAEYTPAVAFRKSDHPREGKELCRMVVPYGSIPLHRMHLVEMLTSLLTERCSIYTSKRLSAYATNADHSLTLQFTDGDTVVTDVLIGADGVCSVVRSHLGRDLLASGRLAQGLSSGDHFRKITEPKWTGAIVYRSLISSSKVRPDHPVWSSIGNCYSGKGKHIIAYPITNKSAINFVACYTVPNGEGTPYEGEWVRHASKEEVLQYFLDWEPQVQELLQALDPTLSCWAVHTMGSLPFAAAGRVAILGDAMHAMTSHLSAGAGQAMEDAHMLGRLLAHEMTTLESVDTAMQIYQDMRLKVANDIVAISRETGLMYELNGPAYDGADWADDDVIARWRKGMYERWAFQWEGAPGKNWQEAERRLIQALGNGAEV